MASTGQRDDTHARLAHAHTSDPDGLQRGHIRPHAKFLLRASTDCPGAASAPAPSTPSPAVAPACASAPVTASGGNTASASRGIASPALTHTGAGLKSTGAYAPASATPSASTAHPSCKAMGAAGHGAVTTTSSASTRPSASASAISRGATGRASAATRASTSPIGVRLEIRCSFMRHHVREPCRIGQAAPHNIAKPYRQTARATPLTARAGTVHCRMPDTTLDLRGLRCPLPR